MKRGRDESEDGKKKKRRTVPLYSTATEAVPSDEREATRQRIEVARAQREQERRAEVEASHERSVAKRRRVLPRLPQIQFKPDYFIDQLDAHPESLRTFNINDIQHDNSVIGVGMSKSGKTTLHLYMWKQLRRLWPMTAVMTGTKENQELQQFFPPQFVYDGFKPSVMEGIRKRQDAMQKEHFAGKKNRALLLYIEDLSHSKAMARYAEEVDEAFSSWRHKDVGVWIASHKFNTLSPHKRQNANFVFISQQDGIDTPMHIVREWMGIGMRDAKMALKVFRANTGNRSFLAINRGSQSMNPYDRYFRIKADPSELWERPDAKTAAARGARFRMADKKFWKSE